MSRDEEGRVLVRIQNQVHRKWVTHEGKGRQGKEEPNSFIRKSEIRRRERLFREGNDEKEEKRQRRDNKQTMNETVNQKGEDLQIDN